MMIAARTNALLDWFIPAALARDTGTRQRARMFVLSHVFGTPLGHLIMAYLYVVDPAPDAVYWTLVGAITAFFAFPFVLRHTGWLVPLSLLSVQYLTVLVLLAAYQYGGVNSPFIAWLVAVPLNALFYIGDRPRVRLGVLTMLGVSLLGFYLLHRWGLRFSERVPPADLAGAGIFSVFCAAAFVSMMSMFYAATVNLQQQALEREMQVREAAETRLRDSEAAYRLLAEHSTDMITRTQISTGLRTYISPAVRNMLGYEPEELVGKPLASTVHPDDWQNMRTGLRQLRVGHEWITVTYRSRRKDGTYVWLETLVRLVGAPGQKPDEAISVARDITARRAIEQELRRAKAIAEEASRAKSQFLANMSHELRTPLNAIMGFSEMIRGEVLGPVQNRKYLEYSRDIHDSGRHLLDLINDVLDLAKLEAGHLRLSEGEVVLAPMIESCRQMLAERLRQARLELRIEVAPATARLRGVETRLRQVLLNLLSNAVKFTEPGGRITVSVDLANDGGIALQVADSGIGIAATDIPQVLLPFGQVESALTRNREGTGLGLPLASHLVELHGGRLELESELGVGTTVTVRLPAERIISLAA